MRERGGFGFKMLNCKRFGLKGLIPLKVGN